MEEEKKMKKIEKVYGVIMAGGGGTRFWPLSRQNEPKQLLNLSGKDLMINETIDRISAVIPRKDIFIVTNVSQTEKMKEAVSGRIEDSHILSEPSARNTAACIGYAAMEIIKKYGDGVMCIFPADHFIKNNIKFAKTLEEAILVAADSDELITIGITPTFPSTGYGYIRYDRASDALAKRVLEFKEKPDINTAKAYIENGEYVWNSGMFVWKASTILKNFKVYLPDIYEMLISIGEKMSTDEESEALQSIYPAIRSISIDYGIMEKSENVLVIPGDFGWNDVGSYDSLDVLHEKDKYGNIIVGDFAGIDTKDSIIYSKEKLVATIGVDNIIIVETPDTLLVCDRSRAQDIKEMVDYLKTTGKEKYL